MCKRSKVSRSRGGHPRSTLSILNVVQRLRSVSQRPKALRPNGPDTREQWSAVEVFGWPTHALADSCTRPCVLLCVGVLGRFGSSLTVVPERVCANTRCYDLTTGGPCRQHERPSSHGPLLGDTLDFTFGRKRAARHSDNTFHSILVSTSVCTTWEDPS